MFGGGKDADPAVLMQRGDYAAAIEAIRARLKKAPQDARLRNQLGDALVAAGLTHEALAEYQMLADFYADDGFTAKALAIWKKMARLAPGDHGLLQRIAGLQGARVPPAVAGLAAVEPEVEATLSAATERPPFPEFLPGELTEIAGHLQHRRFAQGERIVSEGEPGESLFVIAEGSVRVTMRSPEGRELDLARLGAGEFFGEVAVLKRRRRTATITAAEPCELLELSRDDLDKVVAVHPRVRTALEQFIHRRAERTVEAIVEARRGGRS